MKKERIARRLAIRSGSGSAAAARAYRRLAGQLRERIRAAIDARALDPRPPGAVSA